MEGGGEFAAVAEGVSEVGPISPSRLPGAAGEGAELPSQGGLSGAAREEFPGPGGAELPGRVGGTSWGPGDAGGEEFLGQRGRKEFLERAGLGGELWGRGDKFPGLAGGGGWIGGWVRGDGGAGGGRPLAAAHHDGSRVRKAGARGCVPEAEAA